MRMTGISTAVPEIRSVVLENKLGSFRVLSGFLRDEFVIDLSVKYERGPIKFFTC